MQDAWVKEVHREEGSSVSKERRREDTEENKYRLRISCLDRFCIACAVITNRLPLPQYAIRRARSQRCSSAFFLHFGMAASMIYSIPNFHRIHPHKILNLVIPNHIKLLLANRTRLVSESWIGWYRDVLVLGICSGERRSKCSSCSVGGGICERSILRVIARFDPFQLINVPAPILAALGGVCQTLVRSEMPIQMARFLLFTICCSEESSTACRTLVRSSFV